jgi:hypothetical protein
MPTVLRFAGLRVVIYPNDHRPAHVHVIGNDPRSCIRTELPTSALRENYGFGRMELGRIGQRLTLDQGKLCREWERIHGIG